MKKVIIFTLFILAATILNAQKISTLKPTFVVWQKGDENISLNQAKFGTQVNDSITLSFYFNNYAFKARRNYDKIYLEFRWYYYLSTRKSLMYIDKVSYDEALKLKDAIIYSSTQKPLQPGWWEVQVISSSDLGFLKFGTSYKYQIFVKK